MARAGRPLQAAKQVARAGRPLAGLLSEGGMEQLLPILCGPDGHRETLK